MLRKFIYVIIKKTQINKEGKAYLTPICRICYRKKTLIGVLFEKSSLKVFYYLIFEMQNSTLWKYKTGQACIEFAYRL